MDSKSKAQIELTLLTLSPWILAVAVLVRMTTVHDQEALRILYVVASVATTLGVFLFGVSRWSKFGPHKEQTDAGASKVTTKSATPSGPASAGGRAPAAETKGG